MVINRMMNSLNLNLERMSKVQNQLSTGKKITVPSDDPMIASRALKFRSDMSEIEQYTKNSDDALSWVEVTDNTLGSIGDVLQRAREIAVQASSDTNSSQERKKIKEEADQLYNQLVKLGNTSYAGRYIFSGYKVDKPLILEEGGTFNYTDIPVIDNSTATAPAPPNVFKLRHDNIGAMTNINGDIAGVPTVFTIVAGPPAASGEVQVDTTTGQLTFFAADVAAGLTNVTATYSLTRSKGAYNPDVYSYSNVTQTKPMEGEDIRFEVGVGDKIEINTIGTKLFGDVSGVSNTGNHLLNFMNFVASLDLDDESGIKKAVADIDDFMNSVLEQRASVGAKSNRLELTKNRLGEEFTNITALMSKNEDADIAEVIMKLKNEENVYRASLEIGARIIQPSLIDFLR